MAKKTKPTPEMMELGRKLHVLQIRKEGFEIGLSNTKEEINGVELELGKLMTLAGVNGFSTEWGKVKLERGEPPEFARAITK